jgi:hypothetical protein
LVESGVFYFLVATQPKKKKPHSYTHGQAISDFLKALQRFNAFTRLFDSFCQ